MEADVTGTLATFASKLTYDDIPEHTRERCKDILLDALACGIAGHMGEETRQVSAVASALGQSSECTIIGGGRLSLAGATLLNGYLITAVTMCDVHRATLMHTAPEVVPPALALAERASASGRELLAALAAGLEATVRIGIGLDFPAFRRMGWHAPGVLGPFGAAVAAGRMLQLDPDRMAAAIGLAGSQAAGTYAAWGTPTVKFHQCRSTLSGLMAALLAEQGFVATHQFLTAPDGGFYATYCGGGHPDRVTCGLGERWELEQIALRLWPSAAALQGIITALFDLMDQHSLRAEQVERLSVAVSQQTFGFHGIFPTVKGKFEAMLSAHFTAAVALHDRELWLDQFEAARYDDPELRRFAAQSVEVRPDPSLVGAQAVVEVETKEGERLSARCQVPRGSPENPLTRSQIEGKLRRSARGWLSPEQADQIIDCVTRLEGLQSIHPLTERLASSAHGSGY